MRPINIGFGQYLTILSYQDICQRGRGRGNIFKTSRLKGQPQGRMLETYYKKMQKACSRSLFSINKLGSQTFSVFCSQGRASKEEKCFYKHDSQSAVAPCQGEPYQEGRMFSSVMMLMPFFCLLPVPWNNHKWPGL